MKKNANRKKGYITIMMVIAISAISIAVVISLIDSGTSSNRDSSDLMNLAKARQYAEACAEEALQNIRENNNYSGTLNLSFSDGACQGITERISESDFTIRSIASSSAAVKKIMLTINQTSPKINISSWQEKADF